MNKQWAWRTEKVAPEILHFEASLVQRSPNPLAVTKRVEEAKYQC